MNIQKMTEKNLVRITGVVEYNPKFLYKEYNEKFYETTITVSRNNGEIEDHVLILLSKEKMRFVKKYDKVYLRGELHKYKKNNEKGVAIAKIGIFVFEVIILNDIMNPLNEVILEGTLIEKPFYKEKNNKKFTTLILDIPREHEYSDYISVYAIGEKAEKLKHLQTMQRIKIFGRIQSRELRKRGMIFYEVFVKKFREV